MLLSDGAQRRQQGGNQDSQKGDWKTFKETRGYLDK